MRMKVLGMVLTAILVANAAPGQWVPAPGAYLSYDSNGQESVPSDLRIRNNLNRALFADQVLNSLGMRAQISGGVVTLSGRADNNEDAARAVWHAYNSGASLVINQLRIGP